MIEHSAGVYIYYALIILNILGMIYQMFDTIDKIEDAKKHILSRLYKN